MVNPQKETGNVGIANEIFDMLCRTRIPGEARQVLDVIFRQTYGWQKKEDGIALTVFCAKTGLNKAAVCRGIKTLRGMHLIIIRKDNTPWNVYRINKDFTTWKPLKKQTLRGKPLSEKIILSETITPIIRKDNLPLSETIPSTYNYTKNNITKEIYVDLKKSTPKPIEKKPKKLPEGEKYRGKDVIFDNFLNACKKKELIASINPKKFFSIREDYREKVNWSKELQGCINWCFDNDKKFISASRVRNRMEFAIKWAKEAEIKRQQAFSDQKMQKLQRPSKNKMPKVWQAPED